MNDLEVLLHTPRVSGVNWGTGVLIQQPNTGKLLIAQRTDTHNWGSPGGKVEVGETPIQGVLRECQEESNIIIQRLQCYGVIPHYDHRGRQWMSFLFHSADFDGCNIINQQSEMGVWQWADINELKSMDLFPPFKAALDEADCKGVITDPTANFIQYEREKDYRHQFQDRLVNAYSYNPDVQQPWGDGPYLPWD